ncbi:hypothetical protein LCGC14_2072920, partial [marine sediment metagenome]
MTNVATNIVDNVYEPFPEGTYMGSFADCDMKTSQDNSWAGLELSFTDVEPVGDSPEDGRPFKDTITIRVKDVSILEVEDFSALPKEQFALRLGVGLLAGLAEAFGAATRTEDGVDVDLEGFLASLQDGSFRGLEASFITRHR